MLGMSPPSTPALDPQEIVRRIRAALPADVTHAALHEPRFLGNEKRYLADCIDTGWVSYAGSYVDRFEQELAVACGVKHAVAVTSGTVALQVALHAAGIGADDEVLVPALTFVATANAIVHAGGVPHFIDADEATLGVDPDALRYHLSQNTIRRDGKLYNHITGRRIGAILPVHVFGHPADMDAINLVAQDYGLAVIEDATEALGSSYKDRPCGSFSPIATLSFNGNKLVTTGGGGAILTDDTAVAKRLRHLTTTAKQPHRWAFVHDEVAWNFRLPNINAAVGVAQLERLSPMLAAKRVLWQRYVDAFADLQGLHVFRDAPFARSNHWLVSLILDKDNAYQLEPILTATNDAGLSTRPTWTPMHQLPMYRDHPRAPLPVTESLAQRIVSVPSSPFLASP